MLGERGWGKGGKGFPGPQPEYLSSMFGYLSEGSRTIVCFLPAGDVFATGLGMRDCKVPDIPALPRGLWERCDVSVLGPSGRVDGREGKGGGRPVPVPVLR